MTKFKNILALVVVSSVISSLAIGVVYVDYKIYKAKYPNTSIWMYVLDSNN